MQPYVFPYLGYFQLIDAADVFVSYDDVAYITRGWINRNYVLMGCKPLRFTVPVQAASQHVRICDTRVSPEPWQRRFLRTLHHAYGKAPHFERVYAMVETVVTQVHETIADLALHSIRAVLDHLGLQKVVRPTSRDYGNAHLKGSERILDICRIETASEYLNLPGGRALYEAERFAALGIDLRFLEMGPVRYAQFACDFVPNLSMLDVLMFNDVGAVREHLRQRSFAP